jgi:GGDEF domain-containing protein
LQRTMTENPMTENPTEGNGNGAGHGGVAHLLRMAKIQCGASIAFAALRKADGGFAIATFPALTSDPTWSVEAIDELARQTWEDPSLVGGSVLVRSGRALRGMWTGQGHHVRLAAAPLSDPEAPDRPWGLLCVAEPVAGHFEQDQLHLLGGLGVRLTSYLRARQQVIDSAIGTKAPEEPPPSEAAPEPTPPGTEETEPVDQAASVVPPVAATYEPAPEQGATEAPPEPAAPVEERHEPEPVDPFDQDGDVPQAIAEHGEEAWAPEQPAEVENWVIAEADDWSVLSPEDIEWVEAVSPAMETGQVPTAGEPQPAEDEPEPGSVFGTREAPVPEPAAQSGGISDIDAMLGPDPVTGLATLPTLIGRLGTSLAQVQNNEGTVGLVLLEVAARDAGDQLSDSALMTVAGRLTNHLRDRDLVARLGPNLFAVLVDLRPGAVDVETIRQRAAGAIGAEWSAGGLDVRSSVAVAGPGSRVTAEELLRQAAERLRPK